MKQKGKYGTAAGLRAALEERLNRTAREKKVDVMRLRRHAAFDRLLYRLFAGKAAQGTLGLALKGGYALELRIDRARTTKDIDLSFRSRTSEGSEGLRELLQKRVSVDPGDFFEFIIGKAVIDIENAPYGGFRFPVEARLAGREFIRFLLDIALGDVWMGPHETFRLHDWLSFAGLRDAQVPVISAEQQFAEKLHSYTRPRPAPNSRVKDLVDMILLIETGSIKTGALQKAVKKTFAVHKSHDVPSSLQAPPAAWRLPYRKMAEKCGITAEVVKAFEKMCAFCDGSSLLGGTGAETT
jgi:predicted nucleotidyltransferase component of viral defense system